MKLYNLIVNNEVHLGIETDKGLIDLSGAGYAFSMEDVISGKAIPEEAYRDVSPLSPDGGYSIGSILSRPGKLICVGLNYMAHAEGVKMLGSVKSNPILFSKFEDSLVPTNSEVNLPSWETSYDYEAELVIVIGKKAWNISVEEADDYIFGYTAGNDFSCRDAQKRTSQWLIGKALPGFGPCGPCIVTKDEINPYKGIRIRSFVNGKLMQDGSTTDMIFNCAEIVSYASKYIQLNPGDLIFTGTPSGVQLEKNEAKWLVAGDRVDVEIEGIGTLTNTMVSNS